ncbi:MAG: hypothetical protein KDD01_14785 [Phaeodactylibacter sp.]|nr:hypothetical protein [Phaeodactylibacter sp.]
MNIRKIKLALTVGLMNSNQSNTLNAIKDLMLSFQEVGAFLGLTVTGNKRLNPALIKETYAIQFENCTVDVDLVSNPMTHSQAVQGFQLH